MTKLARALVSRRGLFLLGAGASAPLVPIASQLAHRVADLYWSGGVFPAGETPHQDERALRIIKAACKGSAIPALDGELRQEIMSLMPSGFVQFALRQIIGVHRDGRVCPPAHAVFRCFPSGIIWNFNLDGLAERWCRDRHHVLTAHGTVPFPFGTTAGLELVRAAQEYDFVAVPARELLLEREDVTASMARPCHLGGCDFVILIGYTFGRTDQAVDDHISFKHLMALIARDPKPVIVVDPVPDLAEMLADRLKSKRVYKAPLRWNIYASALITLATSNVDLQEIGRLYDSGADKTS